MARDYYETTIALPDATGVLHALKDVNVSVVPRGVQAAPNTVVDIYADEIGITRGPDPRAGATGTNPFTTGPSGSVRFWAEAPFEYDIVFEDSMAPARIEDLVAWNAVAVGEGSIPTSQLLGDSGITQEMLSAEVIYQQVAIGQVIEWWRPSSAVPLPAGFVVAAGQTIGQHEFSGFSGPVTLPNLQNVFILGADHTKTDGSGSSADDNKAGAPGIRGSGGSNQHVLTATQIPGHSHLVNLTSGWQNQDMSHGHSFTTAASGAHAHRPETFGYNFVVSTAVVYADTPVNLTPGSQLVALRSGAANSAGVNGLTDTTGAHAHGGTTDNGGNVAHTHNVTGNTDAGTGGNGGHNNMPLWYGLLRLIKVARGV